MTEKAYICYLEQLQKRIGRIKELQTDGSVMVICGQRP